MLNVKKSWDYGDTFALQISGENKYIIIYNVESSQNLTRRNIVYLKITEYLPEEINNEFLENCEFVCTGLSWFENRFWPLDNSKSIKELVEERSKIKYYPDEFGILHIYKGKMFFNKKSKKILDSLIYLGNFELTTPKDEFMPWSIDALPFLSFEEDTKEDIFNTILKLYKMNNLKESKMFNLEYASTQRKLAQDTWNYSYVIEKERRAMFEKQNNL